MVYKRKSSPATRISAQNQVVACVTYGKEVLVPNPKNQFENQRFRIELTDARYDNETYEHVRNRLKTEVNRMLVEDISEYLLGVKRAETSANEMRIRQRYGLMD